MGLAQCRKPVVLSLWGSDLYGPIEPISRACVPICDEVVVMSEEMREYLGRECTVVPDGVDLEKFHPGPRRDAREAVGWAGDEYQVLFPYTPKRTVKNYPAPVGSSTRSTDWSTARSGSGRSTTSITRPSRTT